ncbi:tyrosine-type recombinase/integrase [Mycoplasmopsis lipophila]|uniref:tyrosine-type recombinase/integrase n=1 Tax=Mycoplasmopsis lipophila TaxID=2117 RepID=UPI003873A7AE
MKNIEQLEIFYAEYEKTIKTNNRSIHTLNTYKCVLKNLQNWETTDELLNQINFLLDNSQLSQNSLFTNRAIYKTFCEWFAKRNRIYIPFNERINKYKIERGTRRAYNKDELNILLSELKKFNNYKFEIIFKILLTTGIRVSEWESINWTQLKENNYEIILKTAKNNNPRPFKIIDDKTNEFKDIRSAIESGLNLNISAKTIKNLFNIFKNFVMENHLDFQNKISAHILRHTFVTVAAEQASIEEISKVIGHVNSNTTASTYLTYNPTLANKKLGKMQQNISHFLNDEEIDEELIIDENKRLKIEIENLKQQLKIAERLENTSFPFYAFETNTKLNKENLK